MSLDISDEIVDKINWYLTIGAIDRLVMSLTKDKILEKWSEGYKVVAFDFASAKTFSSGWRQATALCLQRGCCGKNSMFQDAR